MKRTIIIGDIHGCYEQMVDIISKVFFDENQDTIVFLGDLIDRGPQSWEVIQYAKYLKELLGERCIYIRGNHEQMMMDFYRHGDRDWLYNGYSSTLDSFEKHYDDIEKCIDWMIENTQLYYESKLFNCCHAGSDHEEISSCLKDTLIWDRNIFESCLYDGKPTFIGHTPLYHPCRSSASCRVERLDFSTPYELGKGLIDIDTGCVFGDGGLTAAVVFEDAGIFKLFNTDENVIP